jgi:phosphatidate cytidylyltransferase
VGPLVLGLVAAICWVHAQSGNPLGTDLLLALCSGLAGFEMARLLARPGSPPADVVLPALACAALGAVGLLAPHDPAARNAWRAALTAGALVGLLLVHWRDVVAEAADRLARALVPVVYVGLLFSWLREVGDGPAGGKRLLWVLLISKSSDIAGWLVGKPFGRHKLVPSVSPGKSWEGLAGGLAGSALVAWLLAAPIGVPEASWSAGHRALFGVALGLASVLAGITQSGWKRRVGAKDSSRLIPEMGGVLDMIDSLLFAAPVAVLWFWLAR